MLANTAPLVHRVPTVGGRLKRVKYVARGLAFPRTTREWFQFLQRPELEVVVRNYPHLYHKLQRPYLNCNLTTQQRLEALEQHYEYVIATLSREGMQRLYTPPGLTLATLTLKDVGQYQLRLSCSWQEKEGDLAVSLVGESGTRLFVSSFSIWKHKKDYSEIFIGGLQGSRKTPKELVVDLTRALYGLRPKALMVFAIQQIAEFWKISKLLAVNDAAHIYRHFQKRRDLAASYNEFWSDCGGTPTEDGSFELPLIFVPRDISTIKVNKRQMYRRRYEMLGGIAGQIRSQLLAISRPG